MNDELSLEEAKQIRFDILKEIDLFCRAKQITYFLAFGTLLGAVRHQGFIPWDDDCDVMMPRPDLERFLKEYEENDRYEVISNKSGRGQVWGFGRLVDKRTYSERFGRKFPGVNVEIYPIDGAPSSVCVTKAFLLGIKVFYFLEKAVLKTTYFLMRLRIWPFKSHECFITKIFVWSFYYYGTMFNFYKAKKVALIFGNPYKKVIFDKVLFCNSINLKFEGFEFKVPKEYHRLLTKLYGDYMTPPPVEQRRIHGGIYFYF